MKIAVIFDSNYSNTQKIAEVVAGVLGSRAINISDIDPSKLSDYDFVVLGTPIIGWRPTEKMQLFMSKIKNGQLNGLKATTFDTRVKLFIHGDAMGKLADSLKSFGAEIIINPVPFYVAGPQKSPYLLDGEIEKAKNWANKIKKLIKE